MSFTAYTRNLDEVAAQLAQGSAKLQIRFDAHTRGRSPVR